MLERGTLKGVLIGSLERGGREGELQGREERQRSSTRQKKECISSGL